MTTKHPVAIIPEPSWLAKARRQAIEKLKSGEPMRSNDKEVRARVIRNQIAVFLKDKSLGYEWLAKMSGVSVATVRRMMDTPEKCRRNTFRAFAPALEGRLDGLI